jgi:hypothetical protein
MPEIENKFKKLLKNWEISVHVVQASSKNKIRDD